MPILRRAILAAPALCAPPARAQRFPARTLRIIVPVPAGSVPDIVARLLAERLAPRWEVPVVVDNRPGASGAIGVEAAARAPADGHALLLGSSGPMSILPAVNRALPYDPARDFAPVARVADFPLVLLAARNAGLPDLAALLARRGVPTDYAGGDPGSTQHLAGALLAMRGGLALNHIPYRGGGLAQADLIAGRIPLMVDSVSAVLRTLQDGAAIPLAVFGSARSAVLPAVPTLAEGGVAGCEATGWMGLFAPIRTPAPLVAALARAALEELAQPALAARILAAGSDPAPQDAAAFTAFLAAEQAKWTALVDATGLRIG